MTISNFSTGEHISANKSQYEAARTPFFQFIINKNALDGVVKASFKGGKPAESDTVLDASEVIRLNVTKCSEPDFEVATISYNRGNETINFAGKVTWPAGSITVDDVVGADTKGALEAWKGLTYNPYTHLAGRMGDWTDEDGVEHKGYKMDCTLIELTQDGHIIRTWNLIGCWISKLNKTDFDKANDNMKTIDATIVYDWAEMSYSATNEPSILNK